MRKEYLSRRELDVMQILWEAERPMIASEIVDAAPELTTPTVHTVLKKLIAKEYVQISDIVQSGKVLARSYRAAKLPEDYLRGEIENVFPKTGRQNSFARGIVAALLNGAESDGEMLRELEALIEEKKREQGK